MENAMTDWENRYQQGQTPWDKSAPAPELKFLLDAGLLRGRVLVPGCGRGHDARAIAAAGGAEVIGLDLAPSALREARSFGRREGLRFEEGNLFTPPPEWAGAFDWIWEHTCFCAIDPGDRELYVTSVHALLRPGGRLLAAFFIDPGLDPGETGPPFGVTPGELDGFFGARFAVEGEWAPRACYPGREGRELMRQLRRVDD
jgi:SAM-dependent methyltransferase